MNQTFTGIIEHGDARGRTLGFPTINMHAPEGAREGVYAALVTIENSTYNGMCYIGAAKTFGKTDRKAETYIFDFDQDVYGKEASIELVEWIRAGFAFSSADELVSAMRDDVDTIRKILTL